MLTCGFYGPGGAEMPLFSLQSTINGGTLGVRGPPGVIPLCCSETGIGPLYTDLGKVQLLRFDADANLFFGVVWVVNFLQFSNGFHHQDHGGGFFFDYLESESFPERDYVWGVCFDQDSAGTYLVSLEEGCSYCVLSEL